MGEIICLQYQASTTSADRLIHAKDLWNRERAILSGIGQLGCSPGEVKDQSPA